MSIKNIFKDPRYGNISTETQNDNLFIDTRETVEQVVKSNNEVIPIIDYADPASFAKFGSAEEYYSSTIENIYKNYPYDGSKKEKEQFYNELALYEKYIFDYQYPKSSGYLFLTGSNYGYDTNYAYFTASNPTYVEFNNFNNNASQEKIFKSSERKFSLNQNNQGNTIEFWAKIDEKLNTNFICNIFSIWNQIQYSDPDSSHLFIDFRYIIGSGFDVNGSIEGVNFSFYQNVNFYNWNHYAFTFKNTSTGGVIEVYINGEKKSVNNFGYLLYENIQKESYRLRLGCRQDMVGENFDKYFPFMGSIDEFRFWNRARTEKEIASFWFTSIDGGDPDLGVYYKFNEGITGDSNLDKVTLDYSGKFINGEIKNYKSVTRNTGSAFDESQFFSVEEKKDPIIFSSNPRIQTFLEEKKELGREADFVNSSQFFYLFPEWARNEDNLTNQDLKKVTQVLSSYLDKLYLQIQYLNQLKYNNYEMSDQKSLPFGKELLESKAIIAPELFSDATLLEEIFSRNEEVNFEDKFNNVKNAIYKNIYNNLPYIFKSKGTEKSYRNLFRSFGIDDEILKFVIYTNNSEIDLSKPKVNYTTSKRPLVDFSFKQNHNASVYQVTSSVNNIIQPSAIITSSFNRYKFIPTTLECQAYFPNIDLKQELRSWELINISSSVFGMHEAKFTGSADMTWGTNDKCNYQVYAVRESIASKTAKFALKTTGYGINTTLSSPYFYNVYDNSKWNFAVRIKPNVDDLSYITSSTFSAPNYILEFYGVQNNGDIIENQFLVTQSLSTIQAQSGSLENKRIYIGAHRTNFTGSVLQQSDVKIINARYWLNYLTNETIQEHAKDFNLYSPNNASKKAFLGFITGSAATEQLNEIDTLILNWDFSTIKSSDENGQFDVKDVKISTNDNNIISNISNNYYSGFGNNFQASSTSVIDVDYINIAKNLLPEQLSTSDTVKIQRQDDIFYTPETKPEETFISIENSMYAIISEEMMKMFSTVTDFNNLIATPINAYKKEYKELNYLRSLFFEKVQNVPNFERYLKLFKWIDNSIGEIIKQITPAGSEVPDQIATIIESHILERNKFERRLPLFQYSQKIGIFPIKGIKELLYNWKQGHAPLSTDSLKEINPYGEESDAFVPWLKERAERTSSRVTSGVTIVDQERQKLLKVIINTNNQTSYNSKGIDGTVYEASDYIIKSAAKPYRLFVEIDPIADRKKKIRGIG